MQFNVEDILYKKFLIVLVIFISSIVYSQSFEHFGLKVGTTASSPIWSHDSKSDSHVQTKWGLDIGAFVEVGLGEDIALVPEIHFIQKGLRYDIPITTMEFPDGTGRFITLKPNVNYLSIPIDIKYTFYKSLFELYTIGGGRLDFAVDKNGDGFDYQYKEFNNVDLGVSIGAGVRTKNLIGIGTGLEFRYSPNVTASYSQSNEKITNNAFEILFVIYH